MGGSGAPINQTEKQDSKRGNWHREWYWKWYNNSNCLDTFLCIIWNLGASHTLVLFLYLFIYILWLGQLHIYTVYETLVVTHFYFFPQKKSFSILYFSKLTLCTAPCFLYAIFGQTWLIQVWLTSVVTATIIRHTWINQVWPIISYRKQGAGLSSGSRAAVHKVNWTF